MSESAYLRARTGSPKDLRLAIRAARAFVDLWAFPLLDDFWARLLLVMVVLVLCATRAYIGLIGSRLFSHDAFMLFDGAWRMLNGQRPHSDFYSHVGFLTYVPTVAGLWLSRGTAWGLGYGQALVGLLLTAWAYLLARRRLLDVPLTVFCVLTTLLAIAPFALGFPLLQMSPGTTYNRFGYCLLALCLLEAVAEPRAGRPRGEWAAGASTGAIVGILLFLKITYFAAAVVLLMALLGCRKQTAGRWVGVTGGFVSTVLVCCSYSGFQIGAMFGDLMRIGGGKQIHLGAYMLDEILQHSLGLLAFSVCAALLLSIGSKPGRARAVLLAGVVVSCIGMLVILGNSEESGFPLAAFLAILTLQDVIVSKGEPENLPLRFCVMLFGAVFVASALFAGLLGTGAALAGRIHIAHKLPPLASPILEGFIPAGADYWYREFVDDGLSLVTTIRQPGDTVMSLDFTNPFSYALRMPPAAGGTTVLQYETTFNDRFRPSAEALFGSAKLVAVPKRFSDGSLDESIERLYTPYLTAHFRQVGESKFWRLYRSEGRPTKLHVNH